MRQSTVDARVYTRAKILLLKLAGLSNESIAEKMDTTVPTVRLCLDKYRKGGLDVTLHDRKGRGRKAEITDGDITWVISKACLKPKECGLSAEFWYPASFKQYIHSVAETEGHPRMANVSETKLRQILKNAKLRPFQGVLLL